jgi:hypothetical protein
LEGVKVSFLHFTAQAAGFRSARKEVILCFPFSAELATRVVCPLPLRLLAGNREKLEQRQSSKALLL